MERKVLLLGLLQSLSIFAFANPGFNGTSINDWINTEMASVEEYTRTLPTVESPPTNAVLNSDESPENLSPFGALATDWVRLDLLHDALPRDSVVKKKFKHLVGILRFAYDEATRFSSEPTKSRDTAESQTTESVSTKKEEHGRNIDESTSTMKDESLSSSTRTTLAAISTRIASVDLNPETLSTSRSMLNPITLLSNHAEDDVDSVTTKNISQNSTSREDEEKTTVRTDIEKTASKDSKVELSTIFDTNVGSSTETILKEAFDRPTTHEEYSSETLFKALTTMQDQSSSSAPSGRGSELTNEEADSTSSHRLSTERISAEKTPIVSGYTSAIMVPTSLSSRSQSSYSSSRENLATSTRAENNVGSPETVTTNSKDRNSSQEEYSSPRTLNFERMESTSSTSSRKQKILASTTERNLSVELTPATIPGESSEKSLTWVTTIPSYVTKEAESLSSAAQSQSTSEVKLVTELVSSSIEQFSTTSSSVELHTDANIGLTKNFTDRSSIDTPHENEEIKPENDTEFVTSLKTTGNNQDVSSSTLQSSFTSGSSTDSTSTTHYVDERSRAVPVAKASDLPIEVQHLNKNDTSMLITEENTVDERPTTATVAKLSDLPIEVQHLNENDTSNVVTEKNTVAERPTATTVSKASDLAIEVQHLNENDTLNVVTEKNTVAERPTAATVAKASDLPIEVQYLNKNNTLKVVTETNIIDERSTAATVAKISDLPIEIQHLNTDDTSKVVTEKNTVDTRPTAAIVAKASDLPIEVQYLNTNDTSKVVTEKNTIDKRPTAATVAKASDLPITIQHVIKNDTSEVITEKNTIDKRPTAASVAKASDLPIEVQHLNENDTSKVVTEKNTVDDLVQPKTGSTTDKTERSQKTTDKPTYIKNPLQAGSSRTNHHIFRDYQHRSEDAGTSRSPQSEEIILYESGGNANSANVFRSHVVKSPPIRNNIWRFDKIPENAKPYGYQRPPPSSGAKANFNAEPPSSPTKLSSPSRTNSLTPRKRGSANADVEKQFRWFYTRGQKEPSNNSRNDENRNRKITIQCKSTQ